MLGDELIELALFAGFCKGEPARLLKWDSSFRINYLIRFTF
jgi:hypothetical protein